MNAFLRSLVDRGTGATGPAAALRPRPRTPFEALPSTVEESVAEVEAPRPSPPPQEHGLSHAVPPRPVRTDADGRTEPLPARSAPPGPITPAPIPARTEPPGPAPVPAAQPTPQPVPMAATAPPPQLQPVIAAPPPPRPAEPVVPASGIHPEPGEDRTEAASPPAPVAVASRPLERENGDPAPPVTVEAPRIARPAADPVPVAVAVTRRPGPAPVVPMREPVPAPAADAAPRVQVSIGRIEVRAVFSAPEPPAAPRPAERSAILSLDDYLRQRDGA